MRNVTIKGLLAHKLRLALTALAIVLGVAFISGTFVLTDTLNNTFTVLFGSIYAKIDFQVRGVAQLGSGANATRNELPESLLAAVRRVPGVQAAQGEVGGYAQFVAHDGKAIQTGGAPTLGVSFDPDQQLSPLRIIAGGPPVTSDDVVMDAGTAQKYGFTVGQRVRILLAGPVRTFTIAGIAEFGSADNLAGATLAAFTLPTAQQVLQETGHLDSINVVTVPGASKPAVQRDIARILPSGVQVVTGQTVVNENTSSVSQALSFFSTALLVFAFIALFVGGFTIFNTFSIIVGQRTRELALLRIVGASRRQVFGSVLGEAAITGLVSSVIGLGLGVLAALGLEALLRGFGITLPAGSLVFEPRTVLVGLAVGVGVTVVAAVGPARNAVRIPPVAALDDRQSSGGASLRRRFVWGAALALVGAVMLAIGLAKPAIALVGVGAVGIFVGVAMLSPAIARPISSVIGRPLARMLGEPGKLGRENSMRSPRRTAQTASALMVGLALVAAMSVFGASVSRSATSSADQAISADLIVTATGSGQLSNSVPATASAVPGITATTTVYRSQFELQNTLSTLTAVSTQHLADTLILRMTAGTPAALDQGELLIDSTNATSKHLSVGDTVPVRFAQTGSSVLRIGGIYETNALIGSYLASASFFLAHFNNPALAALLLRTNGSGAAETNVANALASYPNLQVQTRAQFEQAQVAGVNQILGLVYALLALAVLIALIGIVNTLMLSVFERTREIGLLRAVGMKRRQVRTMIRSEAVILSIFGAIIGIIIGTGMGIALVSSLKQQGITDTVVPASNLVVFLLLAALLGLLAATWPARRAARLDVLAAIAAELWSCARWRASCSWPAADRCQPPERDLASALSVSRNTVAAAYQLLRDEGMAESRQGASTRIVPHRTTPAAVHRANGFFAGLLETSALDADLSLAVVDCAPQVAAALADPASVLDRAGLVAATSTSGYLPLGLPALRAAIASHLTGRLGLPADPAQVIVTTGAQQALDLLIRCEVLPGQPVAVEDPTFPGVLDALYRAGARVIGMPAGAGLDPERLEHVVRTHHPAMVYLIPTHHNPTGLVMPAGHRRRVARLAAAHPDTLFVDDMTLTELPLGDTPPPLPLAAFGLKQPNLVSVGSLSKLYWGGLRTGWISASAGLIARAAAAKAAADLGSAAFPQAVTATLLNDKHDDIVKWRGEWLRARYEALAEALRAALPGWTWPEPDGGLTLWVRLPAEADSSTFAQAALRHRVAVVPGRLLSATSQASEYLRLAFTQAPDILAASAVALTQASGRARAR